MTGPRALFACLLLGGLTAQAPAPGSSPALPPLAAPGAALGPLAVDHGLSPDWRGDGCDVTCTLRSSCSPADVAASWWFWNRTAWLPQPLPRPARLPVGGGAGGTTASPSEGLDRSWLLAVAAVDDAEERALAISALGAAGPALGGFARLQAALADSAAVVRAAAILALGEHGGTAARFALLQAAQDPTRSEEERGLCAVAYAAAAAADGGKGLGAIAQLVPPPGAAAASSLRRESVFTGALLVPVPGLLPVSRSSGPMEVLQAFAAPSADGAALVRMRAADGVVPLAALVGAIAGGNAPADQLKAWLERPSPVERAAIVLALAEHPGFHAVAEAAFAQASMRGVAALALAVHGRRFARVGIAAELAVAERRFGGQVDRPLWFLAQAIAGDPAAGVRARVVLAEDRAPQRLGAAAIDALAVVGCELDAVRYLLLSPGAGALRVAAADVVARTATPADVDLLVRAIGRAEDDAEAAGLLVALGRTRLPEALPTLRAAVGAHRSSALVRRGALRGLGPWLRASGVPVVEQLPRGVRYTLLPPPVLAAVARLR